MKPKGIDPKDLNNEFFFFDVLIDPKEKGDLAPSMRYFASEIEGRVLTLRDAILHLKLYFVSKLTVKFNSGRGLITTVIGEKPSRKTLEVIRFRQVDRQKKINVSNLEEEEIVGWLNNHFETGTEGVVWIVDEDGKTGYDGLHVLIEGDYLIVRDRGGVVIFDGVISQDRKAGYKLYPRNPKLGQPCALGMWVHWTQSGWHPDDWARLFVREPGSKLRAVLRKRRPA